MDSGPLLLEGSEESYAGKRLVRVTERNYSLCISSWGSKRASCRKLKWRCIGESIKRTIKESFSFPIRISNMDSGCPVIGSWRLCITSSCPGSYRGCSCNWLKSACFPATAKWECGFEYLLFWSNCFRHLPHFRSDRRDIHPHESPFSSGSECRYWVGLTISSFSFRVCLRARISWEV